MTTSVLMVETQKKRGSAAPGSAATALDAKRLPTAAAVLLARVVELEAFVEAFADEVELGAVDVGQAFGVDQDLYAVALEDMVLGRHFVGVLELVGQARAAGGLDAQAHANALAAARDIAADMAGRG